MQFHAIVRRDGRYYTVEFVDAPGCQTFGASKAEAEAMAQDAVEGWIEAHLVSGIAFQKTKSVRRRLPTGAYWLTVTIPIKIAVRATLMMERLRLGLSQADLARRMGITRQAYQQLESPDANLRLDTLSRAFGALGSAPVVSLVPAERRTPVSLPAMRNARGSLRGIDSRVQREADRP